jgi:hypothetical protein
MKFFLPTLGLLFLALCGLARAQDDQGNQMSAPPDEVITDFGIEEYIAVPKFTLSIGVRSLNGAKVSFTGRGFVSSYQPPSDITSSGIARTYNDGDVLVDTEPYVFTVTNGDGSTTTYTSPQTPPGFTNTWSFLDLNQIRSDGNIDFHAYAADVVDSGVHQKNPKNGYGMEVVVARDVATFGKRFELKALFGISLTAIESHVTDTLAATITTVTDTYVPNLNGQTGLPTTVPYTAPSYKQVPQVDSGGNPVYDSTGSQVVDYVETTVLMTDHPVLRTITYSPGTVYNDWELKGAYFTFRLGPSISYLITDRLKLNLSAGAAMVYAGTNYTVTQTYQPVVGSAVVSIAESDESKLLLGYYLDAALQFDVTERAGVYAGVVYQDAGNYTQTAALDDTYTGSHANYKSLVDLSGLSGFRMGMTFKF